MSEIITTMLGLMLGIILGAFIGINKTEIKITNACGANNQFVVSDKVYSCNVEGKVSPIRNVIKEKGNEN